MGWVPEFPRWPEPQYPRHPGFQPLYPHHSSLGSPSLGNLWGGRLSLDCHDKRMGDKGRLGFAFDLDGVLGGQEHPPLALVLRGEQLDPIADAGTGLDRHDKTHAVEAVVQRLVDAGRLYDNLECGWRQHRKRQVAVRDGGPEQAVTLGALDIDMDPLVIRGAFGELVDALLVYRDPAGYPELLSDERLTVGETEFLGSHDNSPRSHQLNREKSAALFSRNA